MMDMVNEEYPDIEWVIDAKGYFQKKKLCFCPFVCSLSYINTKK